MAETFRILHISDLHIKQSTAAAVRRTLESFTRSFTDPIDCIIATGDIAYTGSQGDYDIASELMSQLCRNTGCAKDRLFLVPGNHDVDRDSIDNIVEQGYRAHITSETHASAIWDNLKERQRAISRLDCFHRNAALMGTIDHGILNFGSHTIGIALLNSAWRCSGDKDKGQIFLSSSQILGGSEAIKHADVKIAAFHHPLSWLHEDEFVKAGALISSNYHIALTGHRHQSEYFNRISPREACLFSTIKAIQATDYPLGCSIIELNIAEARGLAKYFGYSAGHNKFTPDTEYSDNGTIDFGLTHPNTISVVSPASLVKYRERDTTEYTALVEAVAPTLHQKGAPIDLPLRARVAEKDGGVLSLEDIAHRREDFLISGPPLSGKTTLLINISRKLRSSGAIVLRIAATGLKLAGRSIEKALAEALGEPSAAAVTKLLSQNCAILVDQFSFSDEQAVVALKSLKQKHPDVRLIISSRENLVDEALTEDAPTATFLRKFRPANLQPLSLEMIIAVFKKLEDCGVISARSYTEPMLREAFAANLPRWPWVILMFMELIAQGGQLVDVSLANLLRTYMDLRLKTDPSGNVGATEILNRALSILADITDKFGTPVRSHFIEALAKDYNFAGLRVRAEDTLQSLVRSGIVTDHDGVKFSFAAFFDYFHAIHLDNVSFAPSAVTPDFLVKNGMALSFLAARRSGVDYVTVALRIVESLRPNSITQISPEMIEVLNSIAPIASNDSDLEAIEQGGPTTAEVDEEFSKKESKFSQDIVSRTKRATFINTFSASLHLLRSSTFLDKPTKRSAISSLISSTCSMIGELLGAKSLLEPILELESIGNRRSAQAYFTSLIVFIGGMILGTISGTAHLSTALEEEFKEEEDESRKLLLLIWASECGDIDVSKLVNHFIDCRPTYAMAHILQLTLTTRFIIKAATTGRTDQKMREPLRQATSYVAGMHARNAAAAKEAAERHIRETENMAIKLRVQNRDSAPDDN